MRPSIREYLGAAAVIALFVFATIYAPVFEHLVRETPLFQGGWGYMAYVFLTAFATVVAPFSTLPLIPIATILWGPLMTASLSVVGWTLGAVGAFFVARLLKRRLLATFVDLSRVERVATRFVGRSPFLSIFLMRMCVPVDILSYAIGLFVPVRPLTYSVATFFGVIPFAFIFSYASVLPHNLQLILGGCAVIVVSISLLTRGK